MNRLLPDQQLWARLKLADSCGSFWMEFAVCVGDTLCKGKDEYPFCQGIYTTMKCQQHMAAAVQPAMGSYEGY